MYTCILGIIQPHVSNGPNYVVSFPTASMVSFRGCLILGEGIKIDYLPMNRPFWG